MSGDDASKYATQELPGGRTALARRDNGECVYLGEKGCMIHGQHPVVCRTFDCASHYDKHTRAERRKMLALGQYDPEILRAGRQRADARFQAKKRAVAEAVVARVKERI